MLREVTEPPQGHSAARRQGSPRTKAFGGPPRAAAPHTAQPPGKASGHRAPLPPNPWILPCPHTPGTNTRTPPHDLGQDGLLGLRRNSSRSGKDELWRQQPWCKVGPGHLGLACRSPARPGLSAGGGRPASSWRRPRVSCWSLSRCHESVHPLLGQALAINPLSDPGSEELDPVETLLQGTLQGERRSPPERQQLKGFHRLQAWCGPNKESS